MSSVAAEMVSTMLSRAVLLLALLSAALAAEVSESHIMHVPRQAQGVQQGLQGLPQGLQGMPAPAPTAAPQSPAEERSLKLLPKAAVPLLGKFALKPKFPFGLKEKFPFSLKKKLPVFLGGSAAAAAAGSAGSLGALGIHGLDFTKLGAGDAALLHQYPIWKVHRYNGIDLRPVRLGAPAAGPYPAAAPAGPYPAEEPRQVYGPPPKDIAVPEPVYGPPAETYGPPAETYGPPAQTYGPPAETYGPPAETYGPPAETYGPPAETYSPPAAGAAPSEDIGESLEALSQLGALTDLLPAGAGGAGSGALASLSHLGTLLATTGRSKGEILSTLAKLKQSFPELIKSAVTPAAAPAAESAVYHPPAPSGIHGLLQGHPLFSKIANGFSGNAASHVPLPPLPELPALPEIKGLKEIPGIPNLPHIRLPTKYIAQGGPYVSVRYPGQQSAISPRGQLPIPASAPAPTFAPAPAPAPASTYSAPAPASTYSAPAPASTYSALAPATTYTAPAAQASAPAVEIPAAPSAFMLPPTRPADAYAQPIQSSAAAAAPGAGPDNAIQQVSVPQTNFPLPLEQSSGQQYFYQVPATQVSAQNGQIVNSYGVPVNQGTFTYTTNQQYATPVQQYPVQQYSAPVSQYAAPTQQYSAPVTQYAAPSSQYGAPDAFTAASENQASSSDTQGRQQETDTQEDQQDDERVELNPNSRSDHIDAAVDASEATEVRVPMPAGETRAVSQLVQIPTVTPVFNREEQTRLMERLQEMRQAVDQMVDLSAYLDPAHPAAPANSQVEATAAPAAEQARSEPVNQDAMEPAAGQA